MVVTRHQTNSQRNVTAYKRQKRQDDATDVHLLGDIAPALTTSTENCNDEVTERTGGGCLTEVSLRQSWV